MIRQAFSSFSQNSWLLPFSRDKNISPLKEVTKKCLADERGCNLEIVYGPQNKMSDFISLACSVTTMEIIFIVPKIWEFKIVKIFFGLLVTFYFFLFSGEDVIMEEQKQDVNDQRLLEASAKGLTDLVLQLIEEEGQGLHGFKDKVRLHLVRDLISL